MIIDVRGITKRFNHFTAVNGVSFSIKEGEVFGLLGPNGAGKTTTLHMLATLLKPTCGSAYVNNHEISREPSAVRASIGIVFQDPSSDDLLTGYENLRLHALMYGVPMSTVRQRIKEALEIVDLTDRKDDLVKKYSGGMRRRLEMARGLLHTPKVLFLDEPTLGLDPQTREKMWTYIKDMVKRKKVTIIITTHYMDEADRLCDRIAIIDKGKIVVIGSPEKLKKTIGGDIIRLSIRRPHVNALKRLRYVKKVGKLSSGIALTVENANKHLQEILGVVGNVESVEVRSPTLDDVFLYYTGRALHEEQAEGGFWERAESYMAGRR